MDIRKVNSTTDWRSFHRVPHLIYRNVQHWICPPESDVEENFDPARNKAFQDGEAACFVLFGDQNRPVGRIAAFIDYAANRERGVNAGGIGFFESLPVEEHAFALFRRAEDFLAKRGVDLIDGPINFGERNRYWGLLVKGHDKAPLFQEYYHPPYYRKYFEAWGFRPYEQILTLQADLREVLDHHIRRFISIGERVARRVPFTVESLDLKRLPRFAEHFAEVYNEAFRDKAFFKPLSPGELYEIFREMKPIVNPDLVCMAYHGTKPIGFAAMMPEINPFLKGMKGRLNWWRRIQFALRFRYAAQKDIKGVAFGIRSDYQQKGIFAIMVRHMALQPTTFKHRNLYLTTIRGHNEVMVKTTKNLGVEIERVHVTFRKILKDDIPFEPHAFIEL
ncbi:MAG: hypothetical protein R3350_03140 [Saprospiraceae bacterium]|nr:hypothetical protein [Saprospiraceae bacterium]